jgi:hypothetical protein
MKKEYKIYCLSDPRTNEIRYIGLTKKNLETRLIEHISSSKSVKKSNTYKKKWIQSLLKDNIKPIILLIEGSLTSTEVKDKEIYYIAKYKLEYKLTNLTEGGDGTLGYKLSKESKKKIGDKNKIALTGRTLSDEHRKNIGISSQRPCTESAKSKLRVKANKQWSNPELLNKMKERTGSNNPNYGGSKGPVCQLNAEGIILNEYNCLGAAATALQVNQKSLRGTINRGSQIGNHFYKFKKDI